MAKPPEKPVKPISSLEETLFRSFREAMGKEFCPPGSELVNFTPQVDIYTTNDAIVIEMEIPGVDIKDIDISMSKGQLLVKGVKGGDRRRGRGRELRLYGEKLRQILPGRRDTLSS